MSKKVIHTDLTAYQAAEGKQIKMQAAIDTILKEFSKAGIEVTDIREVVKSEDPATFARESYWQENRRFFPAGVDAQTAINGTAYDEKVVQAAWEQYKQLSKSVKPLIIREDSVEISVKEDEYNWYLNEDKKDLHTALEKFLKATKELGKHTEVNLYTIQKAINFNNVLIDNGNIVINPYTFKA